MSYVNLWSKILSDSIKFMAPPPMIRMFQYGE